MGNTSKSLRELSSSLKPGSVCIIRTGYDEANAREMLLTNLVKEKGMHGIYVSFNKPAEEIFT